MAGSKKGQQRIHREIDKETNDDRNKNDFMTQHEAWIFIANDAIAGVRWFGISYVLYTNDSKYVTA